MFLIVTDDGFVFLMAIIVKDDGFLACEKSAGENGAILTCLVELHSQLNISALCHIFVKCQQLLLFHVHQT